MNSTFKLEGELNLKKEDPFPKVPSKDSRGEQLVTYVSCINNFNVYFINSDLYMAFADFQRVDPPQAVCQGGAQARYLVVLVVHPLLQVGHAVTQHFVLVFNHVIASRHTRKNI